MLQIRIGIALTSISAFGIIKMKNVRRGQVNADMKKHIHTRTRRMTDGRLPKNRRELFFDALRWRFSFLLSVGLLLLAFSLPHLATLMYYDISASVLSQETADISSALFTLRLGTSLFQTATYTLLFFGLGGIFHLLRTLAWREPAEVFRGFFSGLRSGWKHFTVLGVCVGVLRLSCTLAETMFYGFAKYLPGALFTFLAVPVLLYAAALEVVYRKTFRNLLSSAAVLYVRTVPVTLLFSLLCTAPQLLLAIPKFTLRYAVLSAAVVVIMPVVLFGWTLYAHHNFDRWINRENYPDLCGRGLCPQDRTQDRRKES